MSEAKVPSAVAKAKETVDTIKERVERTLIWKIWDRLLEIEFADRSIGLAGKAFVSFFPLIIVVAAFVPPSIRATILSTLVHRLGLTGTSRREVASALASADDIRRATGFLGLLFTFFFASSFTTALQRAYVRIWRRPARSGVVGYTRGLTWLAGYLLYMAALGALRQSFGGGLLWSTLYALAAVTISVAAWTATPWLMLAGEVRFRALLTTGIITSLVIAGYTVAAPLWMPNTISSNQNQFGVFGIALALITWLSGAAVGILVSTAAGAVLVQDSGRVGKIARLGAEDLLVAGAADPLPAPTRPGRIVDAFRPVQD